MSDQSLRQNIDELEFEPSQRGQIGVAVENGVVTLIGHVRSYMKGESERVVQRVKDVHGVAENWRCDIRDKKTSDDEIAKRALGHHQLIHRFRPTRSRLRLRAVGLRFRVRSSGTIRRCRPRAPCEGYPESKACPTC